jgi:hypothetical protein
MLFQFDPTTGAMGFSAIMMLAPPTNVHLQRAEADLDISGAGISDLTAELNALKVLQIAPDIYYAAERTRQAEEEARRVAKEAQEEVHRAAEEADLQLGLVEWRLAEVTNEKTKYKKSYFNTMDSEMALKREKKELIKKIEKLETVAVSEATLTREKEELLKKIEELEKIIVELKTTEKRPMHDADTQTESYTRNSHAADANNPDRKLIHEHDATSSYPFFDVKLCDMKLDDILQEDRVFINDRLDDMILAYYRLDYTKSDKAQPEDTQVNIVQFSDNKIEEVKHEKTKTHWLKLTAIKRDEAKQTTEHTATPHNECATGTHWLKLNDIKFNDVMVKEKILKKKTPEVSTGPQGVNAPPAHNTTQKPSSTLPPQSPPRPAASDWGNFAATIAADDQAMMAKSRAEADRIGGQSFRPEIRETYTNKQGKTERTKHKKVSAPAAVPANAIKPAGKKDAAEARIKSLEAALASANQTIAARETELCAVKQELSEAQKAHGWAIGAYRGVVSQLDALRAANEQLESKLAAAQVVACTGQLDCTSCEYHLVRALRISRAAEEAALAMVDEASMKQLRAWDELQEYKLAAARRPASPPASVASGDDEEEEDGGEEEDEDESDDESLVLVVESEEAGAEAERFLGFRAPVAEEAAQVVVEVVPPEPVPVVVVSPPTPSASPAPSSGSAGAAGRQRVPREAYGYAQRSLLSHLGKIERRQ